jgi:hypothetical protein
MSRDYVFQQTDVERMSEAERRCFRWVQLYYAARAYLTDGTAAAREELVKAMEALEVRQ